MTSIQVIEQAVQQLPAHELAEFRRWLTEFDEAVWDAQIEADAGAGKLDALAAEEALAEYHNGAARELSGILPLQSSGISICRGDKSAPACHTIFH